ncbi:MAG: DMT family transporter [Parabacteroides sp.]
MNNPIENTSQSLFQRPVWVAVFALTAAIVWGWAYPLIKLGFQEFAITPDMTGGKMLFAGIRFTISGLIILTVARFTHRSFRLRQSGDLGFLLLYALFNTTFHYAFFYFGLSHSEGARAAILNTLSVFSVVILACLFFKSDRLTSRKITGCLLGFLGILALNLGNGTAGSRFTWLGDGMIILNALSSAIASLMTRGLSRRVDVFVGTGYSLALGGILLVIPSLFLGGVLPQITPLGLLYLLLLIGISTTGFTLYNKLLSCNPVGKIAIYNSLIPIIGAVTSCLCLGETFYINYLIAGALAAWGICLINKGKG